MLKKYPESFLCPCGSGKIYKNCCLNKEFDWVLEDRKIGRGIAIYPELADLITGADKRFAGKFSREPGRDDLVFLKGPYQAELEKIIIKLLNNIKFPAEYIYAFKKTGLLFADRNKCSDSEMKEWDEAVEEYKKARGGE